MRTKLLTLALCAVLFFACGETSIPSDDYLLKFYDTETDAYGYVNTNGDTVIPAGKYIICYTDTFKTYAIVLTADGKGFVGIDRNEKIKYHIFNFDNGPDYASEGLFRIEERNKIGYADIATGEVIIKPKYPCAFPFEGGMAKVSEECGQEIYGEHTEWISDHWFYIDKSGNRLDIE